MTEGDYVHYTPASLFGLPENGRIKSIGVDYAFVVYKCNNEWHRYENYTGQQTDISNLKLGWFDRDGKPIDTPKTDEHG